MKDYERFKQHFLPQGGRCKTCAQPFHFEIKNFKNGGDGNQVCICQSCLEDEVEEMKKTQALEWERLKELLNQKVEKSKQN